ncbi:uncharacterized protein ALTATR162_LOCUS6398 [Alternaria atra]|uniref:Uncharacterized protein n=1 Tax=Alternaria atra TaxID=119953 RepID=A0A8J2I2S7_9PLEO|nr:uncharacterized protein ALTATR162_LOCUS6398 [Alternaria atra]CAG5163274.1 unnamed protein product [Alternaria atra]
MFAFPLATANPAQFLSGLMQPSITAKIAKDRSMLCLMGQISPKPKSVVRMEEVRMSIPVATLVDSSPTYTNDNSIDSMPTQYFRLSVLELTARSAKFLKIVVAGNKVIDASVSAILWSAHHFIVRGGWLSCEEIVR